MTNEITGEHISFKRKSMSISGLQAASDRKTEINNRLHYELTQIKANKVIGQCTSPHSLGLCDKRNYQRTYFLQEKISFSRLPAASD